MGLLQLIGLAGVPKTLHQLFRRKRRPDASSKQEIEENAEELLDPSGPPLSCQAANSFDFDRSCPSNEHSPFSDTVALNNKNKKRASNEYQRISSWTSSSLATSRVTGAPSMLRRHESPPRGQQNCPVVPQTNDNADAGPSNSRNDRMPDRMSITVGDNVSCDLGLLSLQSGSHEAVVEPKGERRSSIYESDDPIGMAQKARHQCFTNEALGMARLALKTNETPVGCVLVHEDKIIAKGMNATNVTRNGTRHAEFMALSALLSYPPDYGTKTKQLGPPGPELSATPNCCDDQSVMERAFENDDGALGHLYPYGQKLHSDAIVDQAILKECILYVTVEPCVMCASLLRQLGIKKVYFGAVNDKFGGTGGVFSIHANADPDASTGNPRSIIRRPPPLVGAAGTLGESFPMGGGDGGNVEPGYEIEGGWGRDEAVGLLRRFYVQENGRAPVPRKKEGRAARLAAMMDKDGPDEVCAALISAEGLFRADTELHGDQDTAQAVAPNETKHGDGAPSGIVCTGMTDSNADNPTRSI